MSGPREVSGWILSGRVQGVGFRWHTYRRASSLGLAGWVRNLPDGRVEVVARGSPEQVAEFATWLARGPGMARVDRVENFDVPHEATFANTFDIR